MVARIQQASEVVKAMRQPRRETRLSSGFCVSMLGIFCLAIWRFMYPRRETGPDSVAVDASALARDRAFRGLRGLRGLRRPRVGWSAACSSYVLEREETAPFWAFSDDGRAEWLGWGWSGDAWGRGGFGFCTVNGIAIQCHAVYLPIRKYYIVWFRLSQCRPQ